MGLFDFLDPQKAAKKRAMRKLAPAFEAVGRVAFPGGQKQMSDEGGHLYRILGGKLSEQESLQLVLKLKALAVISGDSSEEKLTQSMLFTHSGKLDAEDRRKVYVFLSGLSGNAS
jgi:hypothetical protein